MAEQGEVVVRTLPLKIFFPSILAMYAQVECIQSTYDGFKYNQISPHHNNLYFHYKQITNNSFSFT